MDHKVPKKKNGAGKSPLVTVYVTGFEEECRTEEGTEGWKKICGTVQSLS